MIDDVLATQLAPAPGASSWWRRVVSQGLFEMRTVVRHGEQLLLSMILPALFLVVLSRTSLLTLPQDLDRIDLIAPGVLALAVLSSAFTGPAISTGFDRRAGALRLLATTPLGRVGLLAGKVLGVAFVQVLQIVVLGALAVALGWRPALAGLVLAVVPLLLGTITFTALALLIAGTLRPEAVLAGANLMWVLMAIGGGVLVPSSTWWLPPSALGDGLRSALTHVDGGGVAISALVLSVWAALFSAAALRWFRWH